MMDLRELKKEVHDLVNIEQTLQQFQNNWIKPVRSNTNVHLPFLIGLSKEAKKEINQKLAKFQETLHKVKRGQEINEKLRHYTRYLIELKLTQLQENAPKSERIANTLLNDDFLNLKQTIAEVKLFEQKTQQLSEQYNEITEFVHNQLPLEEALLFIEAPHKVYLQTIVRLSQKQKEIIQHIGGHFVSLVRKTQLKRRKAKGKENGT